MALIAAVMGAITVGARKLQDILRSLPDASEVSLNLDEKRLQVKAGRESIYLTDIAGRGLSARHYPMVI